MNESDLTRFIRFVESDYDTGCWNWRGGKSQKGYAKFWWDGKTSYAFRFATEYIHGLIEKGYEPDHLCKNVECVNPMHLEVVTRRVNLIRGNSPIGINFRKTHCNYGHEFAGENLLVLQVNGGKERRCRECSNRRSREYVRRHKK